MHETIKMILTILIVVIYIIFIWIKIKRLNKTKLIISILVLIVIVSVVRALPAEYPFVSFDTPEQAFHYTKSDKTVVDCIELHDCAYVIWNMSDDYLDLNVDIVLRKENGWGYVLPWSRWDFKHKFISGGAVDIYHGSGCSSNMVMVSQFVKTPVSEDLNLWNINDSFESDFIILEDSIDDNDFVFRYYYTVIDTKWEEYEIMINGRRYMID